MPNNALMKIPVCPQHSEQLIHRPGGTYEQCYCGTWYVCPQCGYTVLLPSAELAEVYEKGCDICTK